MTLIEAFEIGVSLVLQDGVSHSVLQAQRDLAALEKAASSSLFIIQTLRDTGSRTASIPVAASRDLPPASPLPDRGKNARITDLADRVFGEQVSEATEIEKSREIDIKSLFDRARSSNTATQNQSLMTASMPAIQQAHSSLAPVDGNGDTRPRESVAQDIGKPQASSGLPLSTFGDLAPASNVVAGGQTPYSLVQPFVIGAPSAGALQQSQSGNGGSAQGSFNARGFGLLAFSDFAEALTSPARMLNSQAYPATSQTLYEDNAVGAKEHSIEELPFLPSSTESATNREIFHVFKQGDGTSEAEGRAWREDLPETLRAVDKPAAVDQRRFSSAQAQQRDSQAPTGDVYLDGTLVGRWVSRFLQKQAERADAGPTGFDAKRSRLLPGVTVGG